MNPTEVEVLIKEFAYLGDQITELQKKRRQIAELFPGGRTEGVELAVYKTHGGWSTVVSLTELRKRVDEKIIRACSRRKNSRPSMRLVTKLNRPKEKKRG